MISPELEQIFDSLFINKVPENWLWCYPSLKNLGSWIRDLNKRVEMFKSWGLSFSPTSF